MSRLIKVIRRHEQQQTHHQENGAAGRANTFCGVNSRGLIKRLRGNITKHLEQGFVRIHL